MRIKEIKLKNIRSYEDVQIDFPSGSLLLSGDIGSGKTSILLAIEYALFGLQPGQTGAALLRNNEEVGEVYVRLEIDGKDVTIERKLKRGKTVVNDYSAITINGEKSELSITELKSKIIGLLNYPQEFIKKNNLLYRYTVYTPQEQMKQIISEDSEVRLNIIRHIFGVDKYKSIRDNTLILVSKIKEEAKLIQGEVSDIDATKNRLSSIQSFIHLLEKNIENQVIECNVKKQQRKKIEAEINSLNEKIKEGNQLETELEKANVLLRIKKENFLSTKKDLIDISKSLALQNDKFDEEKYFKLIRELEFNVKEIELLQNKKTDLSGKIHSMLLKRKELLSRRDTFTLLKRCPTCLQDVSSIHKHTILIETENDLSKLSNEIKDLSQQEEANDGLLIESKKKQEELVKQRTLLEIKKSRIKDLEALANKINDLEKNKDSLEKDIELISKHMDLLKANILSFSVYTSQLRSKQQELKEAFNNEKSSDISLAELKKELELTNKEIQILNDEIDQKEIKKTKLLNLQELIDWLSNHFLSLITYTERSVMLKLRLEFSKLFSKWFSMLVQDYLDVQVDENFTPIIINQGVEMDFSFLSGGERTAVALAYRLALNQTVNSLYATIKTKDIVILDEPTDGFSEFQIDKMRDIFQELKIAQLIIVSHEQKIESFIDNVIKIKKQNHTTSIESPK